MKFKNSRGREYILQRKVNEKTNGVMFFFGKEVKEGAEEIDLPEGYTIGENSRSGLPFIKKK